MSSAESHRMLGRLFALEAVMDVVITNSRMMGVLMSLVSPPGGRQYKRNPKLVARSSVVRNTGRRRLSAGVSISVWVRWT